VICPVCYPLDYIGPDGNTRAGFRGTITSTILARRQPDGTVIRKCERCGYVPVTQENFTNLRDWIDKPPLKKQR